jgi:hypothetical protein
LTDKKKKTKYVMALDGAVQNILMQQPTKNMRLQLIMVQRRGANGEERGGSAIHHFGGN